jgi:mandelamide amidase
MDLIDRTATELLDALERGALRSADLVEHLIARTEAASALNCYVAFDAAALRRQAAEADARRAAGDRRPLLGIPVALKDNIDALGFPSGAGTRALHGLHPAADAELVRRLRAAGALITGKLGLHELAFGITSNNAVTGAVRNPWNPERIAGGSSGGSGAAVAARLVPAAIGTDTGGSVRVPAALCGVAGLRPTVGRVSGEGIAPISTTRDAAGPLARSVADLALIDGVLAGEGEPLPVVTLRGLRLGVPRSGLWEDLGDGVRARAEAAVEALGAAGAELVPVELPGLLPLAGEVSFVVALHEFVRDMRAYLHAASRGVTFEQLIDGVASADVQAIARPLLGDGVVPEAAYRQALEARRRLRALYARTFQQSGVEALVFPTTPSTAARIGDDLSFEFNGRACPTFATFIRHTDPGSNAALPGLSLPIGLDAGLPVGLALDGPEGSDRRLLAIGAAVEAALPPMPNAPNARAAPNAPHTR